MIRRKALHHHPRHRSKRPRSGVARTAVLVLCTLVSVALVSASPASAWWSRTTSSSTTLSAKNTFTKSHSKPTRTTAGTPTTPATSSTTATTQPTTATSTTSSGTSTTTAPTGTTPSAGGRAADRAGALAPGSTDYPVPAGAIFVSPGGSDTADGTLGAPVHTVTRALALAPAGGTVVLRAGTYHESVVVSSRQVTLQSYPHEAVWFDGTDAISDWVKDGTTWRKDGWTQRFDASVGFNKGDVDGTAADWQFINPNYPMAAHPDQVYVDGTQLRQVASRSAVTAGTFFLDESTSQLFIGSDPTGKDVRGATLAKALSVRVDNTVVRGIGFRRYAPSIWHIGAVTVERPGVTLENVTVQDSATIGLGVIAADVTVRQSTIERSGLLGIHAGTADRFRLLSSKVDGNNWERFNSAPVSGGFKAGLSRGILVSDSSISNNLGHGYWSDESVYDTEILNSNLNGNAATGVFLEISARGTIANDLIMDNGAEGIKVNNTSDVLIYNNTVVRNARPLNIVQDSRTPANTSYGHDSRYPNDPEMDWQVGPVTVRNNVLGLPNARANCVLCVEDYTYTRTAAQMGVSSNGNVFNRATAGDPSWLAVWSRGSVNPDPSVYSTLAEYRAATGQDSSSLGYDGTVVVDPAGTLAATAEQQATSVAEGIPSGIAALVGQPTGAKRLGAWGR